MMFYKLVFNMGQESEELSKEEDYIYAGATNMDGISYSGIKKGWFDNIIYSNVEITDWPTVVFYYSSHASSIESHLLNNIKSWPIVHRDVSYQLKEYGIEGVRFLPLELVDVDTGKTNNHYELLYTTNFIEAINLQVSQYEYEEDYQSYFFLPNGIVLDSETCQSIDIFRDSRDPVSLYVSERIKQMIEKNKWVGFHFYPIQATNDSQ